MTFKYFRAAYCHLENDLNQFIELSGIPYVSTPMAKGIIKPELNEYNLNSCRSNAFNDADLIIIMGAK